MHEPGKLRAVPTRPEARPGLTARALPPIRSTIMRPIAADVPELRPLDQRRDRQLPDVRSDRDS
jgi:hypothetical protein